MVYIVNYNLTACFQFSIYGWYACKTLFLWLGLKPGIKLSGPETGLPKPESVVGLNFVSG